MTLLRAKNKAKVMFTKTMLTPEFIIRQQKAMVLRTFRTVHLVVSIGDQPIDFQKSQSEDTKGEAHVQSAEALLGWMVAHLGSHRPDECKLSLHLEFRINGCLPKVPERYEAYKVRDLLLFVRELIRATNQMSKINLTTNGDQWSKTLAQFSGHRCC